MSYPVHGKRTAGSRLGGLVLSLGLGMVACTAEVAPQAPVLTAGEARVRITEQCHADARTVREVWTDYRAHHPFHSQEVAVSAPLAGGCRVIILSEPPPDVPAAKLERVHPALADLVAMRHPVGADGWTEDLAGVLPPMADEEMSELTSDLHVALFGTAYRARLAPIAPAAKWEGTLDVEVRPAELHDWVLGPEAWFWPVDGGPRQRGSDLLTPEQAGVYTSSAPGVVVWSLPKKGPFEAQRANVRMFALESDLVLGAVADDDTVLVIGRERVAPEEVLPPLRFETVEILATSSLPELAQSYERMQLFAGPLRSGWDWAPILLSPALVDTELGSVLNIADQILKRWSENGTITYERFQYPDEPRRWAFARPMTEELKVDSLTYNWNTQASGGLVHLAGNLGLYWMSHTGALNVSYIPGDKPDARARTYEDRARDFFAKQSDPYLVRAVQYTSLFQAFRQLGVTVADPIEHAEAMLGADDATALLETAGERAFQRLVGVSEADLSEVSQRVADREVTMALAAGAVKDKVDRALAQVPPERRAEAKQIIGAHLRAQRAAEVVGTASALRRKLAETKDPAAPRHLALALVHQALAGAATSTPERWSHLVTVLRSSSAREKAAEIGAAATFLRAHRITLHDAEAWREAAAMFGSVDAVEERYREVSARRSTVGRVRTPSIVRSRDAMIGATGGHNVGSAVPTINRTLEPARLAHVGITREGLSLDPRPEPPRPLPIALGGLATRPPPGDPAVAGGRPPPPREPGGGWRRLPAEPSFGCGARCVAVKVFSSPPTEGPPGSTPLRSRFKVDVDGYVFRAASGADISDSVVQNLVRASKRGGGKSATVDVVLLDKNISADEARGLARGVHMRLARQSLGVDDGYVVHRSDTPLTLDGYDLTRAEVSTPELRGGGFAISVSVPKKAGLVERLSLRFSGKGELAPGAEVKAAEILRSGLRSPQEIARELHHQFGAGRDVSLLEVMAVDAQNPTSNNNPPSSGQRHAGTPGHSL